MGWGVTSAGPALKNGILSTGIRAVVARPAVDVGPLIQALVGRPNRSRCRIRWLCKKVYGAEPAEGELPALLKALEIECLSMGIELDFSEWENLCVGPRYNQAFVVRRKASFYVRLLFGRL